MGKKLDPKQQTLDLKELVLSEVYQNAALINLLDRKGIISKQELFQEIVKLKRKRPKVET
ncbi:MAG: hypothetical protein SWH78_16790 [Thermodesulfobacteriota bacterium]|nr:hypothetical protein [Thermodesulfobacteriota bacterium]